MGKNTGMLRAMKIVSIDFGGSTIDVARWNGTEFQALDFYEREDVDVSSLERFVAGIGLDLGEVQEIRVTGGKSHRDVEELEGVLVRHINEIEAIGAGGEWLLRQELGELSDNCLVVSMGTGTCMVAARGQEFFHVGGTGVGGGTFLSLCQLLLNEASPEKLVELFKKGDRSKVDLSVKDIVGQGIGRVSEDMTASNLGKVVRGIPEIDFSTSDLAAGLANLVGQTIATAATFAAKAEDLKTIVLTGKLTRIEPITNIIFEVGKLYERAIILPKSAEYVSAIGAAVVKCVHESTPDSKTSD